MATQAKKYEKVNRDKGEKIHLLSGILNALSVAQECMETKPLRNARMEVIIRIFIIMVANTAI